MVLLYEIYHNARSHEHQNHVNSMQILKRKLCILSPPPMNMQCNVMYRIFFMIVETSGKYPIKMLQHI